MVNGLIKPGNKAEILEFRSLTQRQCPYPNCDLSTFTLSLHLQGSQRISLTFSQMRRLHRKLS